MVRVATDPMEAEEVLPSRPTAGGGAAVDRSFAVHGALKWGHTWRLTHDWRG